MNTEKIPLALISATAPFLLIGCSIGGSQRRTPALFDTKVEAEKAAKKFNCTGAHQMGEKWMPCKSHKSHEEHKKSGGNGHHNH